MGARTFFEVEKVGARSFFLRLKKWGQELFWTGEIGGLVVFLAVNFPKTRPGYPVNFGRSLIEGFRMMSVTKTATIRRRYPSYSCNSI